MGFSGFLNCEISGRYRLIGKSSCSFQMDQWSLPLLMRKIGLTPEHLKWQSKTIPIWLFEVCSSILCLSWWIFKCQERVSLFLGFLLASRRIGLGEERNEESATVPRWKTPETVPITGDCKRTDGEHGPYCRISSMCNPCVGNVNISENSEKTFQSYLKL